MPAIGLILGAVVEGLMVGQQLVTVFNSAAAVLKRMHDEDREEPTLEELDTIAGRISDRQDRIDEA